MKSGSFTILGSPLGPWELYWMSYREWGHCRMATYRIFRAWRFGLRLPAKRR